MSGWRAWRRPVRLRLRGGRAYARRSGGDDLASGSSGGPGSEGWPGCRSVGRWRTGLTLVRPLLDVTRGEVRDYLAGDRPGVPGGLDQPRHPADPGRIRLELLPKPGRRVQPERRRGAGPSWARIASDAAGRWSGSPRQAVGDEVVVESRLRTSIAFDRHRPWRSWDRSGRVELLRLAWRRARAGPNGRWTLVAGGRLASLGAGRTDLRRRRGRGAEIDGRSAGPPPVTVARPPRPCPSRRSPCRCPAGPDWEGGRIGAMARSRRESRRVDRPRRPGSFPWSSAGPSRATASSRWGWAGTSRPLNDFFRGRRVRP